MLPPPGSSSRGWGSPKILPGLLFALAPFLWSLGNIVPPYRNPRRGPLLGVLDTCGASCGFFTPGYTKGGGKTPLCVSHAGPPGK